MNTPSDWLATSLPATAAVGALLLSAALGWPMIEPSLTRLDRRSVVGGAAGLVALALLGPLRTAVLGLAAWALARWRRDHLEQQRRARAVEAMPGLLRSLAASLRAGQSLTQALYGATQGPPSPLTEELRRALADLQLGASLRSALTELGRRIAHPSASAAIEALLVAHELGAALPAVLDSSATTLDDERRLASRLHGATAQARMQLKVTAALAPVSLGAVFVVQPSLWGAVSSSAMGVVVLGGAIALQLTGWILARRLVRTLGT